MAGPTLPPGTLPPGTIPPGTIPGGEGGTPITGTLAATSTGVDVAAFAGDVLIDGTFALTEVGTDFALFGGDTLTQGTFAAAESGADVAAFAGDVLIDGVLFVTEAPDIVAIVGTIAVNGTLAAIEANVDVAVFYESPPPIPTPEPPPEPHPPVDQGTGGVIPSSRPFYPSSLPRPLQNGYGMNHVSPLMRTGLASGRAKQRRIFTEVPTVVNCTWLFTHAQAAAFEVWFRGKISDGAAWFYIEIQTPIGVGNYEARFSGMYEGPRLVGGRYWEFSAELETRHRTVMPPEWGLYGVDFVAYMDIIDMALNREWPEIIE